MYLNLITTLRNKSRF